MDGRSKLIAIAIAGFLVLSVGSVYVRKALEPIYTQGMTAEQVVQGYYVALEEMDALATAGYLLKINRSDPQKKVDYINTFNAMRVHSVGGEAALTPEQWLEAGSPPLSDQQSVLGFTELEITAVQEGLFEVRYLSWYPPEPTNVPGEEEELSAEGVQGQPQVYQVFDRVKLVQRKNSWIIHSIDTVENIRIER